MGLSGQFTLPPTMSSLGGGAMGLPGQGTHPPPLLIGLQRYFYTQGMYYQYYNINFLKACICVTNHDLGLQFGCGTNFNVVCPFP